MEDPHLKFHGPRDNLRIVDARGCTIPDGGGPAGVSCPISGGSGLASFDYDVAGRLTGWTSPFPPSGGESGTDQSRIDYTIDDAGNVVGETQTTVTDPSVVRMSRFPRAGSGVAVPLPGQDLPTVTVTAGPGGGGATQFSTVANFDQVGFETSRTTSDDDSGSLVSEVVQTPGPGGFVTRTSVDDNGDGSPDTTVSYLYDPASERLLAKTTVDVDANTSVARGYFMFPGGTMAEEVDGNGTTVRAWLPGPAGGPLAEQVSRLTGDGTVADGSGLSEWLWLLTDPDGNVATQLDDNPAGPLRIVKATSPYTPYGRAGGGGESADVSITRPGSLLGFQSAHTDAETGNVLLGPRQYDPSSGRFTSADHYTLAGADIGLRVDPLTGSGYLFAAANPTAYHDNGHRLDQRDLRYASILADKALAGARASWLAAIGDPWAVGEASRAVRLAAGRAATVRGSADRLDRNIRDQAIRHRYTGSKCPLGDNPDGSCWGNEAANRVGHEAGEALRCMGPSGAAEYGLVGPAICQAARHGPVTTSICFVICFSSQIDRSGDTTRHSVGFSGYSFPGLSMILEPGGTIPDVGGANFSAGACVVHVCAGGGPDGSAYGFTGPAPSSGWIGPITPWLVWETPR